MIKLVLYLDDLSARFVTDLVEAGWVAGPVEIEVRDPSRPVAFRKGLIGVEGDLLARDLGTSTVGIVDLRVAGTHAFAVADGKLLISMADLRELGATQLRLALLIAWHSAGGERLGCNCFVPVTRDGVFDYPCAACQLALSTAGFDDQLVRILYAIVLLRRAREEGLGDAGRLPPLGEVCGLYPLPSDHAGTVIAACKARVDCLTRPDAGLRPWLKHWANQVETSKVGIKRSYLSPTPPAFRGPTLIPARKWNSWTPSQPRGTGTRRSGGSALGEVYERRTGGGYFVSDGETNVAVDPGFGFLDIIYKEHKITVRELDAVIVTHDHPDHYSELINLLTLRFAYRDDCGPLHLLLNPSTFFLYERLGLYYHRALKGQPIRKFGAGEEARLGGMVVRAEGMLHKEIVEEADAAVRADVGPSAALGLAFSGYGRDGDPFKFAILGDTSFPNSLPELEAWARTFSGADIAAFHLGSLEAGWAEDYAQGSEVEYGARKHLGLNGVIRAAMLLKPRTAVITEFGEELDVGDVRLALSELVKEAVSAYDIVVLPSDVDLMLVKLPSGVHCRCCNCDQFVPVSKIVYTVEGSKISYAFSAGCNSGLSHVAV